MSETYEFRFSESVNRQKSGGGGGGLKLSWCHGASRNPLPPLPIGKGDMGVWFPELFWLKIEWYKIYTYIPNFSRFDLNLRV